MTWNPFCPNYSKCALILCVRDSSCSLLYQNKPALLGHRKTTRLIYCFIYFCGLLEPISSDTWDVFFCLSWIHLIFEWKYHKQYFLPLVTWTLLLVIGNIYYIRICCRSFLNLTNFMKPDSSVNLSGVRVRQYLFVPEREDSTTASMDNT